MEFKLEKIVSALALLTAWAYLIGWLKTYSYFQTFGIGLSSLDIAVQTYLFESWYVVENVFFFSLFLWIVVVAKRKWVWPIAALYMLIPYLGQWSYSHINWGVASWLIGHESTVLKFVPFALALVVIVIHPDARTRFRELSWPRTRLFSGLFAVVVFAWSVSAAKHLGASDGNSVLLDPPGHLSHVKLHISESAPQLKSLETRQNLYMVYASPQRFFVWDVTGFEFGKPGQKINILDLPRGEVEWVEASKQVQTAPGSFLF
jgi:hypothetical protein